MLASIVISTYNRCEALLLTLEALGRQTVAPEEYEILVVDDGSSDGTSEVVGRMQLPCALRVFRQPENRGVSAGRNLGIRHAQGQYLILLSDDLIVPKNFIATHVAMLERFPGYWVMGGLQQLEELSTTPFGRFLEQKEQESVRSSLATPPVEPNLWEVGSFTARNVSLPRADLERTGLFDEQFRISCEDQDLAHRARDLGIRFLFNLNITCVHNDQVADLRRFCQQQRRFAHDGVLFCAKRPSLHGGFALIRECGYLSLQDGPKRLTKKLAKSLLSAGPMPRIIERGIHLAERARLPESWLHRMYGFVTAVYIFQGWREGLNTLGEKECAHDIIGVSRHPCV